MHKVQPGQMVRIITLAVAVPADASEGHLADEISALLSENGVANPESLILDWCYLNKIGKVVQASANPEECEVIWGDEIVCEHCGQPAAEYDSELILCPRCQAVADTEPRMLYMVRHQEAGGDGGGISEPILITWNEDEAYTLAAEKLKEVLKDEEDELPDNFDGLYQLWETFNEGSPYGFECYWVEAITVPAR